MRKINTSDVFKMARLMKEADLTTEIKEAVTAGKKKGADEEEIGVNVVMHIIGSCSDEKVEKKFYDLVAGICEKGEEEIKNQSLEQTVADIKRICEENNIVNFFRSASRLVKK